MDKLENEIIGYQRIKNNDIVSLMQVNTYDFLLNEYDFDYSKVKKINDIDKARLMLKISIENSYFLSKSLRDGFWKPERFVNVVGLDDDIPKINQYSLENQLLDYRFKICPDDWLKHCCDVNLYSLLAKEFKTSFKKRFNDVF